MSPFYVSKNEHGFYRAIFVNQETGAVTVAKSTHSKNKTEAMMIATEWYKNGVPKGTTNSKTNTLQQKNFNSGLNLTNLVNRLSSDEASQLFNLLALKFGFNMTQNIAATAIQNNVQITNTITPPAETKTGKPRIKLIEYLKGFWDYDNSEFIKRYLAHGNNMTKKHTQNMESLIKNYWQPYFGDETYIDELDKPTLDDFFFYLYSERQLKGGTVNKAINVGSRAMSYLFENGKIEKNPMFGVERFKPQQLERGIPTETEVKALLDLNWKNDVYKLAFKIGIFCGLRAGEISGLRVCDLDLDADIIHIRHSWSEVNGLNCPKNSDVRDLPIDHTTLLQLVSLAKENPNYSDMSFVFFSNVKTEQPYWPSYYSDGLYDALEMIGISEEQRKERNIVFHSLGHFFATILSQRTDLKTVQAFMGHRTEEMSKHYSDHETQEKLKTMKNIMQVTWKEIMSA